MKTNAAVIEKVPFTFPVQILKHTEEAGEFHVVGCAATTDFDLQGDVITEEALKASNLDLLKNSTVLLNHDLKRPIGKVIKVEFDPHGLLIDALISSTESEIIQKIKEGVLNKFSIRGQVLERERKYLPEYDRLVNVIKRMSLVEASLVSVPANPEARAIGWYLSKALRESEAITQGGELMEDEQIVIEEISKTDQPPAEGGGQPPAGAPAPGQSSPAPAQPPADKPQEPPPTPAPASQPSAAQPGQASVPKGRSVGMIQVHDLRARGL